MLWRREQFNSSSPFINPQGLKQIVSYLIHVVHNRLYSYSTFQHAKSDTG